MLARWHDICLPRLITHSITAKLPSQAPKLHNFKFLTYTCEPSDASQGFLGAIIPCTASSRINRGAKNTTTECPDIVCTDSPVALYQNLVV